jgi:serine/threonine protein kinase
MMMVRLKRFSYIEGGSSMSEKGSVSNQLLAEVGQCSKAGVKQENEDCCGIHLPTGMDLTHRGITLVMADGVGSSEAGREASEYCVQGFIADYYSTPLSWGVKTAGKRVVDALNSWLYNQGQQRYASELSLASTLAVLIMKSTTAHIFHVGDSRVYRIRNGHICCLTKDHRLIIDRNKSYLARAMGGESSVQCDYNSYAVEVGDYYILTSDGIHEFLSDDALLSLTIDKDDINAALMNITLSDNQAESAVGKMEYLANKIVSAALQAGSDDNASCQVIHIQQLPNQDVNEYLRELLSLPFPPTLSAGMVLDGYRIIREIHASKTIQIYLAEDMEYHDTVVIKTPSVNFEDDPVYIDRFLHEVWVGRRIQSPHVLKVYQVRRKRSCLYYVTEYLQGHSLAQWILDHPEPDLAEVREIIHQLIKGLRAFHRREMVHQDIKSENIMIDSHGTVKIIDFGSTQVAGLKEVYTPLEQTYIEGTSNYIAPELFDGYEGTPSSDMYSLGVTLYEMLSGGHFPYGAMSEAKPNPCHDYRSLRHYNKNIPIWMDRAIEKSVLKSPSRRYDTFSEFEQDLCVPNAAWMTADVPLIERDPVAFWRTLSILLLLVVISLLLVPGFK